MAASPTVGGWSIRVSQINSYAENTLPLSVRKRNYLSLGVSLGCKCSDRNIWNRLSAGVMIMDYAMGNRRKPCSLSPAQIIVGHAEFPVTGYDPKRQVQSGPAFAENWNAERPARPDCRKLEDVARASRRRLSIIFFERLRTGLPLSRRRPMPGPGTGLAPEPS